MTHRRIFSAVLMMSIFAESAATIELNIKLVVISACTVYVHAVGIVRVACN